MVQKTKEVKEVKTISRNMEDPRLTWIRYSLEHGNRKGRRTAVKLAKKLGYELERVDGIEMVLSVKYKIK